MQKVYLLLRNNQQTGPHSLDELVQLGLKPQDLIWVEGKSFGWSYPYEVEALKPYVADPTFKEQEVKETQKIISGTEALMDSSKTSAHEPTQKKVHITLPSKPTQKETVAEEPPADIIERKAEELRKRAQSYTSSHNPLNEPIVETKYARNLNSLEEDYTSWVFNKKTSKQTGIFKKKGIIAVAAIFLLATGGYYFFSKSNSNRQNIAATVSPNTAQIQNDPESTIDTVVAQPVLVGNPKTGARQGSETSSAHQPISDNKKQSVRAIASSQSPNRVVTAHSNESPVKAKEEIYTSEEPRQPQDEVVANDSKQKKTLSQKIGGLFEKLKTKENKGEDESGSAQPDAGKQRQAQERAESPSSSVKDLSDFASLSSNIRSSGWMMGIQGLKLTLHNNSNYLIESASAEVRYFNDQNELLDTKTIHFSNVPSKKAATASAPDHRLADHIEFRLSAATGF